MGDLRKRLRAVFSALDKRIDDLKRERREEGMLGATEIEIRLLG
jgi:hypothetical protein